MFWGKIKEINRVIREVPISEIIIPDDRIRKVAYDDSLRSLGKSIIEHGVLEPLIVRRDTSPGYLTSQYQLIAGERRLKAAEMEGLLTVPCVSIEAGDIDAAVIAIVENLHREGLNIFEEASAIGSLLKLTGMTQEQCARRLSVSQSYIANKLRLMRLAPDERKLILEHALTERHARALLRLMPGDERMRVLSVFIERHMNVAEAEEYVESLLCAETRASEINKQPEKSEQKHVLILKDIRLFYNSTDHAVDIIKKCGIEVESTRKETPTGTLISILLPKKLGSEKTA